MTTTTVAETTQRTAGNNPLHVVAGIALVVPALLACLVGLVAPSIGTIATSMQKASLIGPAQYIGLENYSRLFVDSAFTQALSLTLLVTLVRVLAVAILPPLIVLAVVPFGRKVTLPIRLLFTVPLAMFAPASLAVVWLTVLTDANSILRGWGLSLADPTRASGTLLLIDALATVGIACAVGLIAGLGALRDPAHAKRTLAVCWLIGLLATVAFALQSFTFSYALAGTGASNLTTTLSLLQFKQAFVFVQSGYGATIATIVLGISMLVGLLAALIIVITSFRLDLGPRSNESGGRAWFAIPLLVVILLISLALGLLGILPPFLTVLSVLLRANNLGQVMQRFSLGTLLVNTGVPVLVSLMVQLPLAFLAALGIGALRPLRRWSELLLLPFSPGLFVGVGPLSIVTFQAVRSAHLLNTLLGLAPPMLVSVPMIFVLTLFFKGREPHWRAARGAGQSGARVFLSQLVLPSLPLVALLACASFLVATQDVLWPLIVANKPELMTASESLLQLRGDIQGTDAAVVTSTAFGLPAFLIYFVVFGAFQIFYLDRLILRTGIDPAGQEAE